MIAGLAAAIFAVTLLNVLGWRRVGQAHPEAPGVSVLIPARNEENNLPVVLRTVLSQGSSVGEVLIYDDGSSDATAAVISEFSAIDTRVRHVASQPLPAGWCGKNFACAQLALAATSEWILFLDADARLADLAVPRMTSEAVRRGLTMLSCWPGLDMESFAERALMPLLNFVVFTIYPAPLAAVRWQANLGIAHGACILARRDVYQRVGGHTAVRAEIFEDCRLAQRWRARGERSLCLDGQDVVRVRMYKSFEEIWSGFQKNFFPAFKYEISFWMFLGFHALVLTSPLLIGPWLAAAFVLGSRLLLSLRFRHPLWSVLLHPVSEIVLIALGISSWWRCRSGSGVEWKGRKYRTTRA